MNLRRHEDERDSGKHERDDSAFDGYQDSSFHNNWGQVRISAR